MSDQQIEQYRQSKLNAIKKRERILNAILILILVWVAYGAQQTPATGTGTKETVVAYQ